MLGYHLFLLFYCFKDSSEHSSSDTDTEDSDLSAPRAFLKFPEELHVQIDIDSAQDDDDEEDEIYFQLPSSLEELKTKLLRGYRTPAEPPATVSMPRELTPSEMRTLKHYVAWKKSNGTVLAYKLHAQVLQSETGTEILSIYSAQKLAEDLTELKPKKVDICPNSCIAYTGEFAELESCPFIRTVKKKKFKCMEPRNQPMKPTQRLPKPRAQMMFLPVMPIIKGMFANAETSKLLRYRDKCLQKALHLVALAPGNAKYSDFCDSKVHMHQHDNMGLFQDSRDIAFALSTDGAQLTMKKQSDTWVLILLLLNLPPEIRYTTGGVIYPLAIPGPNAPGNIESFLWEIFEEMATASEGIWMWDAVDSSYFVNHACICMALGDMLGSAKLNGMAGHTAIYGDRFSMVKTARNSDQKNAKSLYYPMSPPQPLKYNPDRPQYNLSKLPMRQESLYWATIEKLHRAATQADRAKITKDSGISRMPLCAASPAFLHPTFFPLDPFHLFYENCMLFIWDLWMTLSLPSDPVHVDTDKARQFGELVSGAMATLPPVFCGPVRDPFLKRQSQYKIYEWMALLHWYIIPIGIELGFNPMVLNNFSYFVEAVEMAMTIAPRSEEELGSLHSLLKKFLTDFERIYVGDDPEKVSRCRLCIFQLIHVPIHIKWNGSIRIGSQATVERAIGELGRKIRSKKAPFANLANIIYEKELVKLLLLYYPSLDPSPAQKPKTSENLCIPQSEIKILKMEQNGSQDFHNHVYAICHWLHRDFDSQLEMHRWGKIRLPGGNVLRSRLSETRGKPPSRSARYFEAQGSSNSGPVFGEALAFFEVKETKQLLVVYHPLGNCNQVLKKWRGVWLDTMEVLLASKIQSIVGIWSYQSRVYILRKHPALSLLTEEQTGRESGDNDEEN
jgi:hypothetical protein